MTPGIPSGVVTTLGNPASGATVDPVAFSIKTLLRSITKTNESVGPTPRAGTPSPLCAWSGGRIATTREPSLAPANASQKFGTWPGPKNPDGVSVPSKLDCWISCPLPPLYPANSNSTRFRPVKTGPSPSTTTRA